MIAKYNSTLTSLHFPIAHCDFETGTCGWTQDTTDDFDWLRHSNNTGSFGTGPVGDHTTGAGTGRSRSFRWREYEMLNRHHHSFEFNFLIDPQCVLQIEIKYIYKYMSPLFFVFLKTYSVELFFFIRLKKVNDIKYKHM